jgi:uncharacterized protein (DUF2147 family)
MRTARPRATVIALAILLTAAYQSASERGLSIGGRWRTIDDKTGAAKSIVVIRLVNDEAEGVVERVFAPPAPSEQPICDGCPGELNGKPIVGMRVMWGFRQKGDEWEGGRVFDPEGKKIYRGKVRVVDNGRKLELRGFVGIPLFGRTQTWVRE